MIDSFVNVGRMRICKCLWLKTCVNIPHYISIYMLYICAENH